MKAHSKKELLFFANIAKLSQLPHRNLGDKAQKVHKFLKDVLSVGVQHSYEYINISGTELVILIEGKKAYVSFRGTDIHYTDLIPHAIKCSKNTDFGRVHKGYYAKFISIVPELNNTLLNLKVTQICFIGHSLGGALSQLAYLYAKLRFSRLDISCVTFGSCKPIKRLSTTYHSNVWNYYLKRDYVGLFPYGYQVINKPIILDSCKEYQEEATPLWGLGKALSSIFVTKRHAIDNYIKELNE